MYIEGIISMPKDDRDLERFEAEVRSAGQVDALTLRTAILPGRRYEQFGSLKEYLAAVEQGRQSVLRAAPILERHKVRLAIENHKDQRVEERLALLRGIGSEYVGACVDWATILRCWKSRWQWLRHWLRGPFPFTSKIKLCTSMKTAFCLPTCLWARAFWICRRRSTSFAAQPDVRFNLETLMRDPLKVPVLTEKYWATFPDVPGSDLARTLRVVRAKTG